LNYLLLIIVLIISIYQLINKFINKEKYSIFSFMVATSCLIISNLPNTNIEIVISTISSIFYIFYMLDFFVITPLLSRIRNSKV